MKRNRQQTSVAIGPGGRWGRDGHEGISNSSSRETSSGTEWPSISAPESEEKRARRDHVSSLLRLRGLVALPFLLVCVQGLERQGHRKALSRI